MSRTGEFAASAGRRPAMDRASGFGNGGTPRTGTGGFGLLVRGARVELGDHVMRADGTVGQVTHLSNSAPVDRWATFHDGQRQHLAAMAHYGVGDSADHYPRRKR